MASVSNFCAAVALLAQTQKKGAIKSLFGNRVMLSLSFSLYLSLSLSLALPPCLTCESLVQLYIFANFIIQTKSVQTN